MSKERMGNGTGVISAAEAAGILGVSRDQVYRMLRAGILRRATGTLRQEMRLHEDEVYALAQVRQGNQPTYAELAQMFVVERAARVGLEQRIARIERVLSLRTPTIKYDQKTVLELVSQVEEALKVKALQPPEVAEWCTLLLGIHEEFFALVEQYLGYPEPWRRFLALAEHLYASLVDMDEGDLFAEVSATRRFLRHAAFFYVAKRRGQRAAQRLFPEAEVDVLHKLNNCVLS